MPNLLPVLVKSNEPVGTRVWPLERLEALFRDIVLRIGTAPLTCYVYVDALDECSDEEAQDTIDFLESLSTRTVFVSQVRLMPSPRYPSLGKMEWFVEAA